MYFYTACGGRMVITDKAKEHLLAHPEVHVLLPEVMHRITLPTDGTFLMTEVEMGRIVGRSGRVSTKPISVTDRVLFAQRIGRQHPSRVVVDRGEWSTKVVVLAFPSKTEARTCVLVTAWIGTLAPREPWDPAILSPSEFQEALDFWCTEALVWDKAVMSDPFESSWVEVLAGTHP